MKKIKLKLLAGVSVNVAIVGDFFLLKQSSVDIKLAISELNIDTSFSVGMSVKFDKQFSVVTLLSDVDQSIEIVIAIGEVSDNSLVGTVDLKLATSVNFLGIDVAGITTIIVNNNYSRKAYRIKNEGPADAFIKFDQTATTKDSFTLKVGQWIEESLVPSFNVFAVRDSSTGNYSKIKVMEVF